VVLSYEQHKWIPFSCFADTEYFVTGVRQAQSGADFRDAWPPT
jgi:hypothetical protein